MLIMLQHVNIKRIAAATEIKVKYPIIDYSLITISIK